MLLDRMEGIEKYGSDYLLNKEVMEGRLFKFEKGIYSEKRRVPLEAILSYRYKDAVFCGLYALYHHGLTDVVPEVYDLATDRNASKISDPRVRQVFMPKEILHLGAAVEDINGYQVTIYDRERTIVELLRNKASLPYDLYKECIQHCRKIVFDLDIRKIEEYASLCPKGALAIRRLRDEVL